MSRVDAAGRSNRAGNASEPVEENRSSVDPAAERRAAEAKAEQRRNGHFATARAPERPAGGSVRAASSVALPGPKPTDMAGIAGEVMRLRAEKASSSNDPARARVLEGKIEELSNRWCELARARGMQPPTDSFDPSRASDAELASALLWTEAGNVYPLSALRDGGTRFKKELHLALIVRSPELLAAAVARGKANDPELLGAMYKELRRLGDDRPCTSADTVESLAARRAELLRRRDSTERIGEKEQERRQQTIGLDGRVGTGERIIAYEIEQGMIVANPGSLLGTIGAGISASQGGSIDDRRRVGAAGNAAQGLVSFKKPGDPDKRPPAIFQNPPAKHGAGAP